MTSAPTVPARVAVAPGLLVAAILLLAVTMWGLTVAATGPFVLGAVHEASGEWTAPLAIVIGAILGLTVAGLLSSRGVRTAR